ncbi:hypothetical protein HK101_004027 [Irineochytrium annulatum]|nr:hypothetical protein HK101_004027 [Irineochytrium annulatum]
MSGIRIILAEGLTGGIMSVSPSRQVVLDLSDGRTSVELHKRKKGTRDDYNVMTGEGQSLTGEMESLVSEVVTQIPRLPMEEPTACEDIYECETSLQIEGPGFRWQNVPPQGCSSCPSSTKPTDEQKNMFKSIVKSIFDFAERHATTVQA